MAKSPTPDRPSSISSEGRYDITVNRVVARGHSFLRPRNTYERVLGAIVTELGDAVETAVESKPDTTPAPGDAG